MTVSELIAILQKCNPDHEICTLNMINGEYTTDIQVEPVPDDETVAIAVSYEQCEEFGVMFPD